MRCPRCGATFLSPGDYGQFYRPVRPTVCPGASGCPGSYFAVVSDPGESQNLEMCVDYQEVKIQEQVSFL